MNNLEKAKKLLGFTKSKDLATFEEQVRVADELEAIREVLSNKNTTLDGIELIKGKDGEPGPQGEQGPEGPPGPPGASIKGDKGEKGDRGEDGKTPIPGVDFDVPDEARIIEAIVPLIPPGKAGKDGSPDTPEEIRSKLESLEGEERLDAAAIKNLPQLIKEKGKQLLVGGIRFLENLADVAVTVANKRQDVIIQYDTTDKRWEDGIAITVSDTAPTNPKINDLWVDTS